MSDFYTRAAEQNPEVRAMIEKEAKLRGLQLSIDVVNAIVSAKDVSTFGWH